MRRRWMVAVTTDTGAPTWRRPHVRRKRLGPYREVGIGWLRWSAQIAWRPVVAPPASSPVPETDNPGGTP